jgi:adenylate cyclase
MPNALRSFLQHYRPVLYASLSVTSLVALARLLGLLQGLELQAFDRLIQLRPPENQDERIVLIGVTDADLQKLGSADISDQTMAQVIRRISAQKPRLIGLDLYRNLPFEPGHAELQQALRSTPNLVGIAKVNGDDNSPAIPGNAELVKANRIAASDVLADTDGRVRRALLVPNAEMAPMVQGLGLRLSLDYLAQLGIYPDPNPTTLTIEGTPLAAFASHDGGYIRENDRGYQLLLNLRSHPQPFARFSVSDVLQGNLPPDALRDRIVMIGTMLPGNADSFFTAYSATFGANAKPMYGVELHAHITSQILSAVLDNRPLIWVLPEWGELLLIAAVAHAGALIYFRSTAGLITLGFSAALVGGLLVGSYVFMLEGGWLPVVPAALAIVGSGVAMTVFSAQQLKTLSTQDELTQLANRRTFNERLEQEWFRAVRLQTPLSLILCDVDYFKRYNDTYGHPQGDECLRQVAKALHQSATRSGDVVARYGGEEFVILLPNTDVRGALRVAEHARAAVRALNLTHQTSPVSEFVTLSLGVAATIPNSNSLPSSLIQIADLALYEAKQKGRNQTILKTP